MSDFAEAAREYLRPSQRSWWRWAHAGDALTWRDGQTIAFFTELHEVLERLAPSGLPPFGTVALLLAICRSKGLDGPMTQGTLLSVLAGHEPAAREGLERLAALPPELREGPQAKADLLRYLLAEVPPLHEPERAQEIVRQMWQQLGPASLQPIEVWAPEPAGLGADLDRLAPGLERLDEGELRRFARTGLEELPEPAPPPLADPLAARGLIESLAQDPDQRGLAAVAREVMAALRLPRPVCSRDEVALGGFSDLSHRGPLDRLLTSELAHDDLTLAARLATGEALFLEREAPPARPTGRRALLVDCGLGMWGLPRVFAAATALGLAATADPRVEVRAFRAQGRAARPVDLVTRDGLEELLSQLEAALHPGAALAAFERQGIEGLEDDDAWREEVVLTSELALADADFRAALDAWRPASGFVATLSISGRLRLYAHGERGRRLLQEVELDLRELFPNERATALAGRPLGAGASDRELPAVFREERFPLLLPFAFDPKHVLVLDDGSLLALTHDRRLMQRADPERGGRELTARVPPGRIVGFHSDGRARAWVVVHRQGEEQVDLVAADLESGACRIAPLPYRATHPLASFVHEDRLYVASQRLVDHYDLASGEPSGRLEPMGALFWGYSMWAERAHGRFSEESRLVPRTIGSSVELLPADGQWLPSRARPEILRLLGPPARGVGARAPVGGRSSPVERMEPIGRIPQASGRGWRVLYALSSKDAYLELESTEGAEEHREDDPLLYLLSRKPDLRPYARDAHHPPHHFLAVALDPAGALRLIGRGGPARAVTLGRRAVRPTGDQPWAPGKLFGPRVRVPGTRIRLREAAWGSRVRVWLDSRGLVHVRGPEAERPQLTLLIGSGQLAGWLSDGRVFGGPFHAPGGPQPPPGEVFELLARCAREVT